MSYKLRQAQSVDLISGTTRNTGAINASSAIPTSTPEPGVLISLGLGLASLGLAGEGIFSGKLDTHLNVSGLEKGHSNRVAFS
jgi:hypothetical protein